MSNRAKRDKWIREAVAITDVIAKNGAGRYLCPLCLDWFEDFDELTLEHAPPESIGGRHIAITCRDCNSRGGHTVDHEIRRAETVLEFAERRMTAPMPATFRFGGVEQRGEAIFGPDGLNLGGIPQQNHPAVTPAITAALERAAASGSTDWTIELSFRPPDFHKAAVGWLRVGYLVAFATLGYTYVLRAELDPVRKQISAPGESILARYCLMTRTARADRLITFVEDPAEWASITVQASNAAVILPSDTLLGTYERLAAIEPWPPGERKLSGKTAPWPEKPCTRLTVRGSTASPRPTQSASRSRTRFGFPRQLTRFALEFAPDRLQVGVGWRRDRDRTGDVHHWRRADPHVAVRRRVERRLHAAPHRERLG